MTVFVPSYQAFSCATSAVVTLNAVGCRAASVWPSEAAFQPPSADDADLHLLRNSGAAVLVTPAIVWLLAQRYHLGHRALVWSCVVATLDNVLRSVLIRMGADLPLLLSCPGVIGGLASA